jgi:L-aspartate oxidase
LLEAIVFANRAAVDSMKRIEHISHQTGIPKWDDTGTRIPEEMVLITQSTRELQSIMTNYVGIVRTNARLRRAIDRIYILYRETDELYARSTVSVKLCELRNAIKVAYLIVKHARQRKESRGLHYNLDFPRK